MEHKQPTCDVIIPQEQWLEHIKKNNDHYKRQTELFKKVYEMIHTAETIKDREILIKRIQSSIRLTKIEKEDLESFAINTIADIKSQ